ncbi:MAG: acireductone synthase [Cyanobacteriota bacterium]|jgi:enolase-phosphatase E1|nr:acireductone synthase [Cyanobacteriota bacterium]
MDLTLSHQPTLVILDIEGTTCPITFVSEVLFPYATARLPTYLKLHHNDPEVQRLLQEAEAGWSRDSDPAAGALRSTPKATVVDYLQLLIRQDRKYTPLKELQGMIWDQGYHNGELQAELFADVAPTLMRWHRQGVQLAVYSSGSIAAQQLLYRHSNAGDLTGLFSGWFDTRTGLKQDANSYAAITATLDVPARNTLFLSDAVAELDAARSAGLTTVLTQRPGNPPSPQNPRHPCVETLEAIHWTG